MIPGVTETKICSKCKERLPLDRFWKRARSNDGRRPDCKDCIKIRRSTPEGREVSRTYDRRRNTKSVARNKDTRLAKKLRLIQDHGGVCADCKIAWPPFVMDFDHRDPTEKEFEVSGSRLQWTYEKLTVEAAKCDLVCSNCHRLRTHRQMCQGCGYCE